MTVTEFLSEASTYRRYPDRRNSWTFTVRGVAAPTRILHRGNSLDFQPQVARRDGHSRPATRGCRLHGRITTNDRLAIFAFSGGTRSRCIGICIRTSKT